MKFHNTAAKKFARLQQSPAATDTKYVGGGLKSTVSRLSFQLCLVFKFSTILNKNGIRGEIRKWDLEANILFITAKQSKLKSCVRIYAEKLNWGEYYQNLVKSTYVYHLKRILAKII
ncbi:uncharacterized protein LOC111685603 isoform X1 [Lucilia cuprina]|uniref:uncharacterized protein LOC111685603 isoform X1 n=1 Tax=Lucilia cuprina TaxID=7375 RepID=UPI001F051C20|nr:uncharacterized protein LOC111685603 isoform X1 [Lucilia cuprina]